MYSITTVYKSVYMSSFSSAYLILGHRGIRAYNIPLVMEQKAEYTLNGSVYHRDTDVH